MEDEKPALEELDDNRSGGLHGASQAVAAFVRRALEREQELINKVNNAAIQKVSELQEALAEKGNLESQVRVLQAENETLRKRVDEFRSKQPAGGE